MTGWRLDAARLVGLVLVLVSGWTLAAGAATGHVIVLDERSAEQREVRQQVDALDEWHQVVAPPVSVPPPPVPSVDDPTGRTLPLVAVPEPVVERPLEWDRSATRRLVADRGFPTEMVSIAGCESVHRPDAHRTDAPNNQPSGDFGLWQINWLVWGTRLMSLGVIDKATDLFDPFVNADAAEVVLREQGLRAWSACR